MLLLWLSRTPSVLVKRLLRILPLLNLPQEMEIGCCKPPNAPHQPSRKPKKTTNLFVIFGSLVDADTGFGCTTTTMDLQYMHQINLNLDHALGLVKVPRLTSQTPKGRE
ncbi:hypothetical protein GOP47_0008971 [Adiantum capillus-veneris]|uniref:Uncharacterized protein n=1 Tax=Adiantum capillus-veneris TaxID=13818 RepID=A0A9D4UZB6_ADICA|nr:hypothetical protein GOP47_0008971 [Adiantum capillus-veneris]